jgi:hypothetical protein
MKLSSRATNIGCHPERALAHEMRQGESKDLRLLLFLLFERSESNEAPAIFHGPQLRGYSET